MIAFATADFSGKPDQGNLLTLNQQDDFFLNFNLLILLWSGRYMRLINVRIVSTKGIRRQQNQ